MKYGRVARMRVERMDDHGRGRGPLADPDRPGAPPADGSAPFVIPGELVEGAFAGRTKGVSRLMDVQVLEPSPDRVAPKCPHAGTCGGCAWQHVAYPRQAELKREAVDRALAEAGLDLRVESLTPAEAQFGHRNRMDYVFGPGGELGLKEQGRWDRPVDLETCLLLSEEAVEVLRRTREWAKASGLPFWDARRHEGYLRYLVIREGKYTGERMATLVTAAGELAKKDELVAAMAPLVTTLYHGINPEITDLSTAKELRLLHGVPELHEKIGGVTYAIPPNSFFQTNSGMAARLLEAVRAHVVAGPHERLLDLYCGSGFFALALAKDVGSSLGVELDADAIAVARRNAEANGIAGARFEAAAAEALSWKDERPDVVIVDPPRSGLHPRVRQTLLENLPPRVVYVSCNHRALALDLGVLTSAYSVDSLRCLDLFPHTPHVETVVHLIKK